MTSKVQDNLATHFRVILSCYRFDVLCSLEEEGFCEVLGVVVFFFLFHRMVDIIMLCLLAHTTTSRRVLISLKLRRRDVALAS